MTEVIYIEGKPKGSKIEKSMKKIKNTTPFEQHLEPSKIIKKQRGSKEEKCTVKEVTTRATRYRLSAIDNKTDMDKLAEATTHIEGR